MREAAADVLDDREDRFGANAEGWQHHVVARFSVPDGWGNEDARFFGRVLGEAHRDEGIRAERSSGTVLLGLAIGRMAMSSLSRCSRTSCQVSSWIQTEGSSTIW